MGLTRRAVCSMQVILACMFASSQTLHAATLNICWTGAAGYTMTGRMSLPDQAMAKPLVTEKDITGFEITGYRDGIKIGSWSLKDKTPETTWFLRFEPATLSFPVGDLFNQPKSQGWNAHGQANDCGTPGFGFNSGSAGQDVCVNGVYERSSSIPPETPLIATYDPVTPDCGALATLSKRR